MKTLLLFLLLAGLGLAQTPTQFKVRGSASQSGNALVSYADPDAPKMQVATTTGTAQVPLYTTTPVASQGFYLKFEKPNNPEVFIITNSDGKPLVRCVAKTQTCKEIQ